MASTIPTSTSITESTVISAPLSAVWHLIKLQEFHRFWSKLSSSEHEKGTSPETDVVKWTFKDGTVYDVKQEEHSRHLNHSALCRNIWTSRGLDIRAMVRPLLFRCRCWYAATSHIYWSMKLEDEIADLKNLGSVGVIEDARFKRREALTDLANVATSK
ncbi:hypothetical protein MMC07_001021 [Pseudocyphellaria aurata]|nr:hypothetical protein [Pseudocyphellaria aurata]